jgi:hypothetical protein
LTQSTINKYEIEGKFFNLIKGICKNSKLNATLNDKRWTDSPLTSGPR